MTDRAPVGAFDAIEILTERWVASVRVTVFTVIPEPEKVTADVGHVPARKFEPVRMIVWFVAA